MNNIIVITHKVIITFIVNIFLNYVFGFITDIILWLFWSAVTFPVMSSSKIVKKTILWLFWRKKVIFRFFVLKSPNIWIISNKKPKFWILPLTLKIPGGGGSTPPGDDLTDCAIFRHRNWPVNISKFKYIHPGHFATILRSLGCLEIFWPPLEGVGPPKYFRILMNFDTFLHFWPT